MVEKCLEYLKVAGQGFDVKKNQLGSAENDAERLDLWEFEIPATNEPNAEGLGDKDLQTHLPALTELQRAWAGCLSVEGWNC